MCELEEGQKNLDQIRLSDQWLLEEQKQRRQEIENIVARIEADLRYGLLASAVIWSWLAKSIDSLHSIALIIVSSIPVALSLFFQHRSDVMDKHILFIAKYTKKLEGEARGEKPGWERWIDEERKNPAHPNAYTGYLKETTEKFWNYLVWFNTAAMAIIILLVLLQFFGFYART